MSISYLNNRRFQGEMRMLTEDPEVKLYFHYESSGFKNDNPNEQFSIYGYILPQSFPYNYGSFKVQIKIPPKYPFKAPQLIFLTYIYHRNIHVCGDVLTAFCCHDCPPYTPATRMYEIIKRTIQIIDDPDRPIEYRGRNDDAEGLYHRDKDEYWKTVMNNIEKYAYHRTNESISSLKFITKRILRKQLEYDSTKINQLLIPRNLKEYLHVPFDRT